MATAVAAGAGSGPGRCWPRTRRSPAASRAVPGGIGAELPSIFREANLTPLVLLLSIATAFALGAGHALTPGHGKTLMAAYLVGTKGTPIHAVGLGLSITVSHTIGILVIAGLVVGAQGLLPPDVVVRAAPAVAAVTIAGLGGWMLLTEVRKRRAARRAAPRPRARARARHGPRPRRARPRCRRARPRRPGARDAQPRRREPQPPPARRARRSAGAASSRSASPAASSRRRAPCSSCSGRSSPAGRPSASASS